MINKYARNLYYDGSDYTEHSEAMRSWESSTMTVFAQSGGYIYIGAPHSFAARFIRMSSNVNAVSANLTVEYYYRDKTNPWRAVKNLRDETKVGTATLGKSGFICWDLPEDWVKTTIDIDGNETLVPELPYNQDAIDGYGYYWIRIKSSQVLTAGTAIEWLGLIWTSQDYMKVKWPEVDSSNYLPTGKTDWYELIEMSTGDVADDLNIANVIDYELQAKDINEMAKLTALKTMINILIPMTSSDTLRQMKEDFEKDYTNLLKKRLKGIDQDQDETLKKEEKQPMSNARIQRY